MVSNSDKVEDVSRIALKLTYDSKRKLGPVTDIISVVRSLLNQAREGAGQDAQVEPLVTSVSDDFLQRLVKQALTIDPRYVPVDFGSWYLVKVQLDDSEGVELAMRATEELLTKLRALDVVESAHGLLTCPPPVSASDDPRSASQGYLDAAPNGIDARYAWTVSGGDGAGVGFVDLEQGWNLNHEDLAANNITLISGNNNDYFSHGTSVLGEVLMVDNNLGGIGIAPNASGRVVSQLGSGNANIIQNAIISAVSVMQFGDILLLEAQAQETLTGPYLPVEIDDATYDVIRLATALGIVVVEAGSNGSVDLDQYTNALGKKILDRSSADFRESGAIMVGAGSSTFPHSRLSFSNHGSRIDLYAWGENIDTTTTDGPGTDNDDYTSTFGGTSGASPIVSGAAILLQAITQASRGRRNRFGPLEIRRILQVGATASSDPANDRIGVMPNLKAIINSSDFSADPDIYIRDYIGDTGDPTSGSVSASPDIVLLHSSLLDPVASIGAGSGNENNNTLSQDVVAGRDHFLYIRAFNRGGNGIFSPVTATVCWAEPATLIRPDRWNLIGSTTTPSVPPGNLISVFDAITWPGASLPAPGHYCFITIISTERDPGPTPADFQSFDNYVRFVSNNNNVAWRNFNIVSAPPSSSDDFHGFRFLVNGKSFLDLWPHLLDFLRVLTHESALASWGVRHDVSVQVLTRP